MAIAPTIRRYFLVLADAPEVDIDGDWMRVADVEAVFLPGVAYMPVPHCDRCRFWHQSPAPDVDPDGTCDEVSGVERAPADFGCVQWKAKA
jgi:hypothetical protein